MNNVDMTPTDSSEPNQEEQSVMKDNQSYRVRCFSKDYLLFTITGTKKNRFSQASSSKTFTLF